MNFNGDCTVFEARGGGGGGVFPDVGHIGMYRPHRIGFLHHFGLKLGMIFKGITGVYERIYGYNS